MLKKSALIIGLLSLVLTLWCVYTLSQPFHQGMGKKGKGQRHIQAGEMGGETEPLSTEPLIPIDLPIGDNSYITFNINCHDFSDVDLSAKTVTNLIDLFEARNLKAEFYFTDLLFREYMKKYPHIIKRLKKLNMTISYHLRAPHPVTFKSPMTRYLTSLPKEQLLEELRKYETHGINPVTGKANTSGEGGYAYMKSVIGYPPPVAGLNAKDKILEEAELQVLKEMGLRMTVKGHEKQKLAFRGDILIRPAGFGISRLQGDTPWYASPSLVDVSSSLQGNQGFGLVNIHEADFYTTKPGFYAIYYELFGERESRPKNPPFDLTATSKWCRKKTKEEQAALWSKYTEILDYVASHSEIKVITSSDIIRMVDEYKAKTPKVTTTKESKIDPEVANLPLYISFIIHNEEDTRYGRPVNTEPDYDGNKHILKHFSMAMRELGKLTAKYGIKLDFGPDWTFIDGIKKYDPSFFQDMVNMGHRIEPHGHETMVLYGEIISRLEQFKIPVDPIASGFDESKIQEKMRYFDTLYPKISVLWGAAVPGHKGGEEQTGYVWRPSRDNWLLHDPNGKYIYIGHGTQWATVEGIKTAISQKDPGKINTYSLVGITRTFKADPGTSGIPEQWTAPRGDPENWYTRLQLYKQLFQQLDKLVKSGQIQYRCLMDVKEIFEKYESKLDMSIDIDNIPRSTAPPICDPLGMEGRGKGKGRGGDRGRFEKGKQPRDFPPTKRRGMF